MADNFSQNALAMDQMVSRTMPQASQLINADVATQNMLLNKQRQAQEQQAQTEAVKLYNQDVGANPQEGGVNSTPVQNYAQLQARQEFTKQKVQSFTAMASPVLAQAYKTQNKALLSEMGAKYKQVGAQLGVSEFATLGDWMQKAKFEGPDISVPMDLSNSANRDLLQGVYKQHGLQVELPPSGQVDVTMTDDGTGKLVPSKITPVKGVGAGGTKALGGNTVNAEVWRDKTQEYINQGMSEHEARAKARVDMLEENREGSATADRVKTQQAGAETAPPEG